MPITDPLSYISKIAGNNGVSGKTQGTAIAILKEARRKRVSAGKDPMGLAAASLYIACLQNKEKMGEYSLENLLGDDINKIKRKFRRHGTYDIQSQWR